MGISDPSPHRQQVGSATPPQGGSDCTVSVARFTKTKFYREWANSFRREGYSR